MTQKSVVLILVDRDVWLDEVAQYSSLRNQAPALEWKEK